MAVKMFFALVNWPKTGGIWGGEGAGFNVGRGAPSRMGASKIWRGPKEGAYDYTITGTCGFSLKIVFYSA